jgi:hypothetical protein
MMEIIAMRRHEIKALTIVFVHMFLASTILTSALAQDRQDLMKQASIVFRGTVKAKGEVFFKGVPKSEHTIVVIVDEVIRKPSSISLTRGQQVTVSAITPASLSTDSSYIFYAEGWIYGSAVAVREIGHEAVAKQAEGTAVPIRAQLEQSLQELSDRELRSRLDAADMVVVGEVTSVQPWKQPLFAQQRPRISEHAPNWQEAVIRVKTALKGELADHEVIVRFPGSWDVAWASTPKLKTGQAGTFILQKDKVTGVPVAALAGKTVNAHTALEPGDVLPASEADRVRKLLER